MNKNVTAIILIILAVAVYLSYTQGAWSSAMAVKSVNDEYISAISSAETLVKLRDKVDQDAANISPLDQAKLAVMLPVTPDNIDLIVEMNAIADSHNLILKDIKAVVPANQTGSDTSSSDQSQSASASLISLPSPKVDKVNISFSVSTQYSQFINFLQDLETTLRIMDVTSLTVSSGDSGIYNFSVAMNTYWLGNK